MLSRDFEETERELTSVEAVHGLVGPGASFVGDVELEWKEIVKSVLGKDRVHTQETAVAGPQGTGKVFFDTVNGVSVDDGREGVELVTRA